MIAYAERGIVRPTASRLSVCLSIRLSITLRYRDHIGWKNNNFTASVRSADPHIADLLPREHPEILGGINQSRNFNPEIKVA